MIERVSTGGSGSDGGSGCGGGGGRDSGRGSGRRQLSGSGAVCAVPFCTICRQRGLFISENNYIYQRTNE